jgi:hypothetical protein
MRRIVSNAIRVGCNNGDTCSLPLLQHGPRQQPGMKEAGEQLDPVDDARRGT